MYARCAQLIHYTPLPRFYLQTQRHLGMTHVYWDASLVTAAHTWPQGAGSNFSHCLPRLHVECREPCNHKHAGPHTCMLTPKYTRTHTHSCTRTHTHTHTNKQTNKQRDRQTEENPTHAVESVGLTAYRLCSSFH